MVIYSFLLIIYLNILTCASIEEQTETPSKTDIFSRHLSEQLLHKVLQYDAKSTGRMAKANRALKKLAVGSRTFRYFEGAGWDMSELANICEFGVTDAINRPQLETELVKILSLSHIKDETTFNETLETLLFKDKFFKELAVPVLKYLVRRFYARKDTLKDKNSAKRRKFLVFTVENRVYDVFFELIKDPGVFNGRTLEEIINDSKGEGFNLFNDIHDSFYFDCYNNYVYDDRSSNAFMWKKMAAIVPSQYSLFYNVTNGGEKLSRCEMYAWIAVCIHRRVPEKKYAQYLSNFLSSFLDIVQEFVYKYSLITFDDSEKEYYYNFIKNLCDKYFKDKISLEHNLKVTKVLNDVRFGYVNDTESLNEQIEGFYSRHIAMLLMAASKANKKELVKQIYTHPKYGEWIFEMMIERRCPHSFKICFDIIEGTPIPNMSSHITYMIFLILDTPSSTFKIIRTTTTLNGFFFEIQSPAEYIKLGFASKYEVVFDRTYKFVYKLITKMFDDAAKAGAEEFIQLITDHCGEHVKERSLIFSGRFIVSYEVIRILLEHQELIGLLANREVKLFCRDERINPDAIAKFRHVINPT